MGVFGPEIVAPIEFPGIERAAQWHADQAAMWRKAIHQRIECGIGYGEQLMTAEAHEDHADSLRGSITAEPKPDKEWYRIHEPERYALLWGWKKK